MNGLVLTVRYKIPSHLVYRQIFDLKECCKIFRLSAAINHPRSAGVNRLWWSTVLYCTVLHCVYYGTALYCTVHILELYCTVHTMELYCVYYGTVLCILWNCTVLCILWNCTVYQRVSRLTIVPTRREIEFCVHF